MSLYRISQRSKAALCLLLCLCLLIPYTVHAKKSNEQIIFEFLRDDMGFGNNAQAVACGILANMYAETGGQNYAPDTTGDSGTSGGICGWHDGTDADNWTRLKNYCKDHGYQWDTLGGQLHYLKYDLFDSGRFDDTRGRLMAVENDMHGAWYAAYLFCYWYEAPANRVSSAMRRGTYAEDFWHKYVDPSDQPVTSGDPAQSTLAANVTLGPVENKVYRDYFTSCSLRGTVDSNYPITGIDCYVSDAYGHVVSGYHRNGTYTTIRFSPTGRGSDHWDSRHFDIYWDGADANLPFSAIDDPGSYFFCIDAADVSGNTLSYRCLFHVIRPTESTYTFLYSPDGAAVGSGTAAMGSAITLPALGNQPGFLFAGWCCGSTFCNAGESFSLLAPEVDFYAVWDLCPHRWGQGIVTEPTIYAGGYTTYTCLDCGAEERRDLTAPLPSDLPGDVNGDGLLTFEDLELLARHVADIAPLEDTSLADVNGDGSLSAADLTALAAQLKYDDPPPLIID